MIYTNEEIRNYTGIHLKKINAIARKFNLGQPLGRWIVFNEKEHKKIMNESGYSYSKKNDYWIKKNG